MLFSRSDVSTHFMKTTIYILTILLFACGQSADKTNLTTIKNDFVIPFLLDSLEVSAKPYNVSEMQVPMNDVIFIGSLSDTINLNKYDRFNYENYLDFQDYGDSSIIKDGLKIFVSNRQLLTIDLENFSIPPPPILIEDSDDFEFDSVETAKNLQIWKERPREFVQAIPIIIYNPAKDTIYLDQQDGRVIMIQEAKDENGEWKPIEFWRYSWCGNSYGAERLLPKTLAIVKVFKYDGDFETEIRIKLKNGNKIIYSESYKGRINKSQFELPPDIKENFLARRLDDKEYLDRIFLNK